MRVVIAEDQVLLREGLGRLFADDGHEVAAFRADARDLVTTVAGHRPDLVVVDVRMPPTFTDEGARAAYEIKRAYPQVGVLVLSQHVETSHAIDLVTVGGFGYLLKDRVLAVDEFLDAAERVARGGSALDPQVVARLLSPPDSGGALSDLSEREREVLTLMAEGLTNTGSWRSRAMGAYATAISRWSFVAERRLAVLGGGLGERLLECALAAGFAGDRQLWGPGGDAADERCGALAARDLYRCTLTELSEQPGAVLLW